MNKQELIEKFEERKTIIGNFQGYAVWWEDVKEIFEQLDEPQPIKIPQFVADWIEVAKPAYYLSGGMTYGSPEVNKWLAIEDNQEIFARAWLDGYEVEEEKRYLVKVKGIVNALSFLSYHKNADIWTVTDKNNSDGHRAHHTRKELEETGFGWVFDCEGVEIEEVE